MRSEKQVSIYYKNYRGELGWRTIMPDKIWFGSTEWHPNEQWHLDAFDIEKKGMRSFAMNSIIEWKE